MASTVYVPPPVPFRPPDNERPSTRRRSRIGPIGTSNRPATADVAIVGSPGNIRSSRSRRSTVDKLKKRRKKKITRPKTSEAKKPSASNALLPVMSQNRVDEGVKWHLMNRAAKKVFAKMREYARVRNTKFGDVFREFNDNGDGGIDLDEFSRMLKRMHMDKFVSEEQTKLIFDVADPDGSGEIDYREFCNIFDAEDPLAAKKTKLGRLKKEAEKHKQIAKEFATEKERYQAQKRISELRERLGEKLLQKLRAMGGNTVGQDGRALWRIYKEMDVDGDGVVTYDEFKEMVGPNKFNLGLHEDDVKDLIVVCDPDANGIIECDEFLRAMMNADENDGKDVFIDYPQKMIDDMLLAIKDMDAITPDHIKTSVDSLAPLPESSIPKVDPATEPEIPEKTSSRSADIARTMRKVILLDTINNQPRWQDLSCTHKTVQQTRIAQARQRKSADLRGTFEFQMPRVTRMHYPTSKSYAHSPQRQNTYNRTMYGEDNTTHHAIPDILNDKHRIAEIRRARGLKRLQHEKRLWQYRRDTEKIQKMNEVRRLVSKMKQRKEYLRLAKAEGDRQFKHLSGQSTKGLLRSEFSLRQRHGNMKYCGVFGS